MPGGGHVRAAAQVLPAQLAAAGVHVVVDGQLGAADLDGFLLADLDGAGVVRGGQVSRGPLSARRRRRRAGALEADQLQLVRLVGQLVAGLGCR